MSKPDENNLLSIDTPGGMTGGQTLPNVPVFGSEEYEQLTTRRKLRAELLSLLGSPNTPKYQRLQKLIELYGKEVARNVRHKSAEICRDTGQSGAIMNIQFREVDSK